MPAQPVSNPTDRPTPRPSCAAVRGAACPLRLLEGQNRWRAARADRRLPLPGPKGTLLVAPVCRGTMNTPLTRVPPLASKKWARWPILSGGRPGAATARIPLPGRVPRAARINAPHPVEILTASTAGGRVYELDGHARQRSASVIHPTPPSTWPNCWWRVLPPPQIRPLRSRYGRADAR